MALYEYLCQQCGNRSEVLQKMADPPLTTCTLCGGPLKKLLSSPAVQFKGSGWYVTDYARKPGGGSAGGRSEGGGESKSEGAKSESKSGEGSSSSAAGGSSSGSGGSASSGGGAAAASSGS